MLMHTMELLKLARDYLQTDVTLETKLKDILIAAGFKDYQISGGISYDHLLSISIRLKDTEFREVAFHHMLTATPKHIPDMFSIILLPGDATIADLVKLRQSFIEYRENSHLPF